VTALLESLAPEFNAEDIDLLLGFDSPETAGA